MTNAASTWVGLIAGVGIGSVITWWVYYRQKKIAEKQDHVLAIRADNDRYGKTHLRENTEIGQKI